MSWSERAGGDETILMIWRCDEISPAVGEDKIIFTLFIIYHHVFCFFFLDLWLEVAPLWLQGAGETRGLVASFYLSASV